MCVKIKAQSFHKAKKRVHRTRSLSSLCSYHHVSISSFFHVVGCLNFSRNLTNKIGSGYILSSIFWYHHSDTLEILRIPSGVSRLRFIFCLVLCGKTAHSLIVKWVFGSHNFILKHLRFIQLHECKSGHKIISNEICFEWTDPACRKSWLICYHRR